METNDHRGMWKDLGLDLKAHDGLLQVLGSAYADVYMSQKNRPSGMGYLDFVMSEVHGLRVQELVDARKAGRKVIGSFCLYVPEEIILAVEGVSVGLCAGAEVGAQAAEGVLPRNTCALIKSFMGFKLSKVCPYVEACDLVVGETTCDGKTKAYEIFQDFKETFILQIPRMKSAASRDLWRGEVRRLAEKVEAVAGRKITAEGLERGIRTVNSKRKALHRLNALRSNVPSPISGLDALLINQVQFYDDPVRLTGKIEELCDELDERVRRSEGVAPGDAPRVLLSGCPLPVPNWKVPHVIEKNGAVIVGEESCVGERGTRNLVPEGRGSREELLDRIADRYFQIDCAVFTPNPDRLTHIIEMARRYRAHGVIHYAIQFCMPYQIEAYRVAQAMEREKIPFLRIETDYSSEDVPQIETRVQAFLETLGR